MNPVLLSFFAALITIFGSLFSAFLAYKAGVIQAENADRDKQQLLDKAESDKKELVEKNGELSLQIKNLSEENKGLSSQLESISKDNKALAVELNDARKDASEASKKSAEMSQDMLAFVNGANNFCYFLFPSIPDTKRVEIVHNGYPLKLVKADVFRCPQNYSVTGKSFETLKNQPYTYNDGSEHIRFYQLNNVDITTNPSITLVDQLGADGARILIRFRALNGSWLQYLTMKQEGPRYYTYESHVYRLINNKIVKLI